MKDRKRHHRGWGQQWEPCRLKPLVTGLVYVGIGMLALVAGR